MTTGIEIIQKHLNNPQTQAKAMVILQKLHELKTDDHEAAAIAIMVHKAVDKVLEDAYNAGQ